MNSRSLHVKREYAIKYGMILRRAGTDDYFTARASVTYSVDSVGSTSWSELLGQDA